MKKINSFYIVIALFFIGMLTLNSFFFQGSQSFLGITYSKVYKINAEKSSIIGNVHVVPGQTVNTGDILVELESPELNLEISKLRKEIQLLESEKKEKDKLLESKIKLLESERTILYGEIANDIRLIQNEIDLNTSLTNQILKGQNKTANKDSVTSLQLEINSIREKGSLKLGAIDIRIADTRQDHEFDQSQIQSEIELAQEELNWRLEEKDRLNKYATSAGVIENVYVKTGEEVKAFSSIISINPEHPSSVVGYMVGSKERNKTLGERVIIRSLEQSELETEGSIIGFGSVVALPEILQKSTAVKAFGLEVFIEIPERNGFAVGEKIIVK